MSKAYLGDVLVEEKTRVGTPNGNDLPLIGVSNKEGLILSSQKRLADVSKYKIINCGWIAYNPMRINVGSIGHVDNAEKTGIISPDYVVFSCTDRILPKYFMHFIKSKFGLREISQHTGGSVRERLYFKNLSKIQIELPSVEIQLNKVQLLEKNMDALNGIQNELTSSKALDIALLRQKVLQLAVQGKLTAQWRSTNPSLEHASELLKRIEVEKQQLIAMKEIKKDKSLPPIEDKDKLYKLPDGWVWCRLTELVHVGTGSTPSKSNISYYHGGTIPWYTSSATNDSYAKVQNVLITQKALDETNCKIFPPGSLIIALYGQGKTRGQISELVTPGATNQAIAGMVFYKSSSVVKEYLKHFFKKIYHEIRLLAEGGAQPNLNVGKIKSTLIPLPPVDELLAIVEKVNAFMALCDELEQEIDNSQTQIEQLMQSCLREVFEVA